MLGFARKLRDKDKTTSFVRDHRSEVTALVAAGHTLRLGMNEATQNDTREAAINARGGTAMILQGLNSLKGGEPTDSDHLGIISSGYQQIAQQLEHLTGEAQRSLDAFASALDHFKTSTGLDLLDTSRLVKTSKER